MEIQNLRRTETTDVYILMALARAPLQSVTEILNATKQVNNWHADAYESFVDNLPKESFFFSLRGMVRQLFAL